MSERTLSALPGLAERLSADQPIAQLEAVEDELKLLLRTLLARGGDGDTARRLAEFQRDLGLLLKYKSYAVKASSPLGYSIFLQNPGEGFSFQRHRSHKTEIFHVIAASSRASLFLCDYEDWCRVFERRRFARWLEGAEDPAYERFRFVPRPGDVVVIDTVGVVHSVMGCVLEEFAAVSTDMVDRLFDQNEGREVPPQFTREGSLAWLRAVEATKPRRRILHGPEGFTVEPLRAIEMEFGHSVLLGETAGFSAHHLVVEPRRAMPMTSPRAEATSLFVLQGSARLLIRGEADPPRIPAMPLERGECALVAPRAAFALQNVGSQELVVSEHRILPEVALI